MNQATGSGSNVSTPVAGMVVSAAGAICALVDFTIGGGTWGIAGTTVFALGAAGVLLFGSWFHKLISALNAVQAHATDVVSRMLQQDYEPSQPLSPAVAAHELTSGLESLLQSWSAKSSETSAETAASSSTESDLHRNAMERLSANVMIANSDYEIVYTNESLQELFKAREAEIREQIPEFDAASLVGTSMDVFHKNPAHQRELIGYLKHTHTAVVTAGGVSFRITVNPIADAEGNRVGTAVEWDDITAELNANEKGKTDSLLRQALDSAKANVMLADANDTIIYMNGSVSKLFHDKETEIRQDLPNFDASKLVGKNMDVFLKTAAQQPGLIDRLKGIHGATATVGGVSFRISTTTLEDNGERLGTIVEWEDITAELAANVKAKSNSAIRKALDSATSKIMLADAKNNIIYMNAAVANMFKIAEVSICEDIPGFSADALVGKNMDCFHKTPVHQQDLVRGLTSTYKAEAKIGELTLQIVTSPLIGRDGERLGTVVEWLDHTDQIAVEEEVHEVLTRVSQGDLSRKIEGDYTGFFGSLKTNINQTVDKLLEVEAEVQSVLANIVDGDLTSQIEGDYQGFFGNLKDNINATVIKLIDVVTKIKGASESVATGSLQICQGNANLSQRTEEQASNLEETSTSMEEMTATVQQNAENAREADTLAQGAKDKAEHGGEVVGNAITAMKEINGASKRIADIISVIDEIAFQTNLLALNASVEAARAGEQGRGFAVVASEVRNLAGRSATAAKEIKELIEDSVSKVEQGSKLVDESGKILEEIIIAVQKVTHIVGEISCASVEQAAGIKEVNRAIAKMDEMTQQNSALVEEAAAASEAMGDQAGYLNQQMSFFKLSGYQDSSHNPVSDDVAEEKKIPDWLKPESVAAAASAQRANRVKPADSSSSEWEEF